MFRRWFVAGFFLLSGSLFAAQVIDSAVSKVTVYRDRAQVTRTAEVMLAEGLNTVRFEHLPERTEAASLQASGTGRAMLSDVQFKVEHFKAIPDEQRKALYAKRDELIEKRTAMDDERTRLKQLKGFLEQISKKVTFTAQREGELELDPEKWNQMLTLYAGRAAEYDQNLRKVERDRKELQKEIDAVEADIREAGFDEQRRKVFAELELVAEQAGKATVELSYIVRGPAWTPVYDVRVDTAGRNMEIAYYASIRQSTGEDWTNVEMGLSTANPGLGGKHPELTPWRIDERRPVALRESVSRPRKRLENLPMSSKSKGAGGFEMDLEAAPALAERKADIQTGSGAVVFAVKGRSTIEADNVSHRVAISRETFGAVFRYSTVPKLSPVAYLKAKAVNDLEYPLLPGRANVFLDGNFITTSTLELIAPQEEFWLFLGADEGVKVEHKLVKRYRSTEGLIDRRVRYAFDYEIKLHNTHSVPENVVVRDQLPISGSEHIRVELVEPRISRHSTAVTMDEDKFVEWSFRLNPNQKKTVPFRFYVEAPVGVDIGGLNVSALD